MSSFKNKKLDLPSTVYLEEIVRALAEESSEEDFLNSVVGLVEKRDEEDVLVAVVLKLLLLFVKQPQFDSFEFYRLSACLTAVVDWCKDMEDTQVYPTPNEDAQADLVGAIEEFFGDLQESGAEASDHRSLINQKKRQGLLN